MKELVEKVAELYAAFEKDAKAQVEMVTKLPVLVHARLRWKLKRL